MAKANPKPSSRPDPFLPILVGAAFRLGLRLAFSLVHGGGSLADAAFPDINLVVLVLGVRWFRASPPGSEERRRARFAIWVAISSLTVGAAWRLVGPPTSEAVVWSVAAFGVVGSLYLLLFYTSTSAKRDLILV